MYEFTLLTVFFKASTSNIVFFTRTVKENIIQYLALHILQVKTVLFLKS